MHGQRGTDLWGHLSAFGSQLQLIRCASMHSLVSCGRYFRDSMMNTPKGRLLTEHCTNLLYINKKYQHSENKKRTFFYRYLSITLWPLWVLENQNECGCRIQGNSLTMTTMSRSLRECDTPYLQ